MPHVQVGDDSFSLPAGPSISAELQDGWVMWTGDLLKALSSRKLSLTAASHRGPHLLELTEPLSSELVVLWKFVPQICSWGLALHPVF